MKLFPFLYTERNECMNAHRMWIDISKYVEKREYCVSMYVHKKIVDCDERHASFY